MSSVCVVVWGRAHCVRDEYRSPGQVVNFSDHLLMSGTVAGWFFFSSRGGAGGCLSRRQTGFSFLLSCLIFRTDNTASNFYLFSQLDKFF